MANSTIFDAALTAAYQSSAPVLVSDETIILDFQIVVPMGATVRVLWYLEFASGNPFDSGTKWFREVSEEDIGNGDVRMPMVTRRFSTYGGDADLPAGTYYLDVQLKRVHDFCRVQIQGNGASAKIIAPVNDKPSPA